VNGTAPAIWESPAGRPWLMLALLAFGSLGTVAATVLGNGNIIIALAPLLFATAAAFVWFLPLRFPLFVLIFVGLTIDSAGEGPWDTPLAMLGSVLHVNLAKVIPGTGIPLPGMTLLLGALLLLHFHRSIAGIRTDSRGRIPTATIMVQAIGVSLLAVLALCALGLQGGGDMKMAKIQVQTYVLVLVVGYLCSSTLRGVRDYRIVGVLVIVAACIKSFIALYVAYGLSPAGAQYATSHGDSLLFAAATAILMIRFAEMPRQRNFVACVLLLPLLVGGMVANDRRLVWVQILIALVPYWVMSRRSQIKRYLVKGLLLSLPLIIAYIGAGWNSSSKVFAPVKTLRSVGDSEVDSSTLYRDLENYNLLITLRLNMLTGSGFGHPFVEQVVLPNISFFEEYRYMPHNSVLGLWAFCGPFGFTGLTAALVVAIYLAVRSYELTRVPDERVAAMMVIGMILIYMVHCWGDIGFSERRSLWLVGPALAIAGQLAMSTGAWRIRTIRPRSSSAIS
jgi:hypothetical protein